MKGKDRIRKVMACEIPDRVPFDGLLPIKSDIFYIPLVPSRSWQPPDQLGVYPQVHPSMLRNGLWRWSPHTWKPPKNWMSKSRQAVDEFGCHWEYSANDPSKGHPSSQPLGSWDQLDTWTFPNPYDKTRYSFFTKMAQLFPQKYKVGLLDSFLFARVQYLRGFTTALIDLRRNRPEIKLLFEKLKIYYLGTIEMFHRYGMDAVFTQDDMGAQSELFMSPSLYQNHVVPFFQEIVNVTHDYGMKFILHSCGKVNDLIPIWQKIGVDALQFDSPHMNGLDFLKQFGGKICFYLVPDIQTIYPFVSPMGIEAEVKQMIAIIGSRGGLVIRDYPEAIKVLRVPPLNVRALASSVKKWGKYPIAWI